MSLFSENIDDDFDDFDDLQQELSKPRENPLLPLSSNQTKDVLPEVSKQTKREESKNQSQFPSIPKPSSKDTFPSLNKKQSVTKLTSKKDEVNELQDDSYQFDEFENDEFQNTTNQFAANLDKKTKQFQQINKNIKQLENSIHKPPSQKPSKKESKQSSRAGTGMIGDDDDPHFSEFGESGNNQGVIKNNIQMDKPIFVSKPKLSIKLQIQDEQKSKQKMTQKLDNFDDDQFNNIDVLKLLQEKRQKPPKFQTKKQNLNKFQLSKYKKTPLFLQNNFDQKPNNLKNKSANSRSNKQFKQHDVVSPKLFQKKRMTKQKTQSASLLLPIHRKDNSSKSKKDPRVIRQAKIEKNNQFSSSLASKSYPTKVNASNINLHVEHTIKIAREKLSKMEAAQQSLLNSADGQDEEKIHSYYQKENRSL